jgi:hypothetical protein
MKNFINIWLPLGLIGLIFVGIGYLSYGYNQYMKTAKCEEFINRTVDQLPVRCLDFYKSTGDKLK